MGEKGTVLFEECPKLHLTTGLRKGQKTNKNALLLNLSTLAFSFRKPKTSAEIPCIMYNFNTVDWELI